MRKHLNNPRIVLPLAFIACVWGLHSYGLLDKLLPKLPKKTAVISPAFVKTPLETSKETKSQNVMNALIRDQWLPRDWEKLSSIRREPFVANYDFDKAGLPDSQDDAPVIIESEKLEAHIAEQLGLDRNGFFVRFENVLNKPVRKRPGDLLHTADGRVLSLGQIGIAEAPLSASARVAVIERRIRQLELNGSLSRDDMIEESPFDENSGISIPAESAFITGGRNPGASTLRVN